VTCTSQGLDCGLFRVAPSWNGKHPNRIPFYGSMGSVSYLPSTLVFAVADDIPNS
jgi:hypothetical protein